MQQKETRPASKDRPSQGLKSLVLVTTLAMGLLLSLPAHALKLGRLTSYSALGEPLRLEIEVLELNANEVDGFKVALASPQNFASRGLAYGPVLDGIRLALTRTDNGRLVIRIEGQRPAGEPFVDLLLDLAWASGAATREVSLLLAPAVGAAARQEPPRAAALPSISPSAPVPLVRAPLEPVPVSPPVPAPAAATTETRPESTRPPSFEASVRNTVVRRGDTAGQVASRERPADVDQSQYLLALLQKNPAAFAQGNVNRLKAGAVLNLPTAAQAQATPVAEARQIIATQWEDFRAFRQQLAGSTPTAVPNNPVGEARGQVENLRSGGSPATPTDKLTLSKPAAQSTAAKAEQALLEQRQAKDAADRLDELARNMRELSQVQAQASGAETGTGQAPGAAGPAVDLPATQAAPVSPPVTAEEDTSLIKLADHPAVLPVVGGLLALALAWLGLRLRRRTALAEDEFQHLASDPDFKSDAGFDSNFSAGNVSAPDRAAPTSASPRPAYTMESGAALDLDLDLDDEPARGSPSLQDNRKAALNAVIDFGGPADEQAKENAKP